MCLGRRFPLLFTDMLLLYYHNYHHGGQHHPSGHISKPLL